MRLGLRRIPQDKGVIRWLVTRSPTAPELIVLHLRPQADEFVRRFLLHVLPPGFQGIRHFGMLTNRTREAKLQQGRHLLKSPAPAAATPDESEDYRDRYWLLSGAKMPS